MTALEGSSKYSLRTKTFGEKQNTNIASLQYHWYSLGISGNKASQKQHIHLPQLKAESQVTPAGTGSGAVALVKYPVNKRLGSITSNTT